MKMSMLESAGPDAEGIIILWWVLFSIASLVFTGVMVFLVLGAVRSHKKPLPDERKLVRGVAYATGATIVLLICILVATFKQSQPFSEKRKAALSIEVIGRQWWWEVIYLGEDGSPLFKTANEIVIPIGVPVRLLLKTADVIHSFWVPNLGGKMDMIPGRTNELWLQADKEGLYRGQCAEFCGAQHTLMAFYVKAKSQEKFKEWMAQEKGPAKRPQDKLAQQGQEVFLRSKCIKCHSIRGLSEQEHTAHDPSENGPDLTHLASRESIAAGTLPNKKGHLAGWIADPQSIKPGNLMPDSELDPQDLHALLRYLETLR